MEGIKRPENNTESIDLLIGNRSIRLSEIKTKDLNELP